MTEILLYHHIQGLTDGVKAFADKLRNAGHTVHTPDVLEGATFNTLEEGIANAKEVGFNTLQKRGLAAAEGLNAEMVYAGFSSGVMEAQELAQTRPGARGALFLHSCLPVSEFGDGWPDGVPVQIHAMDGDPFFVDDGDIDAAKALVDSTDDAELFLYPGKKHLFSDSSLSSYVPAATKQLTERVLAFLQRLG
ncbi:MAG: dienelactone hydrolase [Acidimicrobiia bacterium]|nr:dienelactone hydrolase [Acidimicrobiia bacterium]